MDNRIYKGIVKTIVDGIKDAQMQYDYAVAAKDDGEQNLAKLHLDEASRRLSGVSDWRKRLEEMTGRKTENQMEKILWEYYDDWKDKLYRRITEFKF